MNLNELVGETLKEIDIDEEMRQVMLTTESGRIIQIHHDQDCCEDVRIVDTEGNWHDLVGKVIVEATQEEFDRGDPPPEYPDSWTRTNLTFRVDGATVINRWIGESNGYYSESVDISEVSQTLG